MKELVESVAKERPLILRLALIDETETKSLFLEKLNENHLAGLPPPR